MEKVEKERYILDLSKPALEKVYGAFSVDNEQLDSPDTAITLDEDNKKRIGIEITSVDKQDILQYLNDEKTTQEITQQQIHALSSDGSYSKQPTKKISIPFPKDYIFDGVIKKESKYNSYIKSGNYDEVIIVAFSEYLSTDYGFFDIYIKLWTDYLLSKKSFSFSKVLFVSTKNKQPVIVYDKNKPRKSAPKPDKEKELGIATIKGPIVPFGETVNINDIFDEAPLVQNKTKNDLRKARKNKKKMQKKSRKQNAKR